MTRVPFRQIKNHPHAYQLMKDNACYINEHLWDKHEWDLHQVGFVTSFNPKYYSDNRVTNMFRNRLIKALPKAKIPTLQKVLKSHCIDHNGRKSGTQAYAIDVPTHMSPQLIPLIKEVTKDTKEFVPFQMRRRNPDTFQSAIRYQNHILDCITRRIKRPIEDTGEASEH